MGQHTCFVKKFIFQSELFQYCAIFYLLRFTVAFALGKNETYQNNYQKLTNVYVFAILKAFYFTRKAFILVTEILTTITNFDYIWLSKRIPTIILRTSYKFIQMLSSSPQIDISICQIKQNLSPVITSVYKYYTQQLS